MNELTAEEAIAAAGNFINIHGLHLNASAVAAYVWREYFSRVRPAAPEPEVVYGPCELRSGVWVVYDKHGTFLRYRDGLGDGPTGKNYRYVRVGDVPACPPPTPAPPMPEGPMPKRIIARKDGEARHGTLGKWLFIDGYGCEMNEENARSHGWEIEIVEGRDHD